MTNARLNCTATTKAGKPCARYALPDSHRCKMHALPTIDHLPETIQTIVLMERIRTTADRDKVSVGGRGSAFMPSRLTDRNRAAARAERVYLKLTAHEREQYAEWIGSTEERVRWFRGVQSGDVCDYRNGNHGVMEIPAQGRDRVTAGNYADEFDVVPEVEPPPAHVLRAKLDYVLSVIDAGEYSATVGYAPPAMLTERREWLRPYQCAWVLDFSRYRIYRKSRQIGITDVGFGFEGVGIVSGLFEAAGYPVVTHNALIISKNHKAAKEAVAKSEAWVEWFGEDPDFAYFMGLSANNTEKIEFERSGFAIMAEARSKNAGVSFTGHIYLDEFAVYGRALQEPIFRVAMPMISSNPGLRASVISTTRGTAEMFYDLYTDENKYRDWARHFTDIWLAIDQGFPIDPAEVRRNMCATDQDFAQEFEAKFVGTGSEYIKRELVRSRMGFPPDVGRIVRNLGVDVASERDLTALVPVERYPGAVWWRRCYIIQGVPYLSNDEDQIIGQDRIVAALIEVIDPENTILDVSGDGGQLLGALNTLGPPTALIGHSFHRAGQQFKNTWIPAIRAGLETGDLWIEDVTAVQYSPEAARAHIVDNQILDPHTFVEHAFIDQNYPQLLMDFLKIHRKQTKNGMTFDATRESAHGHGDGFMAGMVGHSITVFQDKSTAEKQRDAAEQQHRREDPMESHDYIDDVLDYL